MIIYHVVMPTLGWVKHLRTVKDESGIDVFPVNFLISYLELRKRRKPLAKIFENILASSEVNLFVDSGAYGAGTKNIEIPIDKYIEYVKENRQWIKYYANLDVKYSWQKTADNQKEMEDAGLAPLPVFHGGEPDTVKQDLLDNYEYICVGGIAGTQKSRKVLPALRELSKEALRMNCRIHLFGMGGFKVLRRAYYYSSDSTNFVGRRYGEFPYFDDAALKIINVPYRTAATIRYEHLISRYGLPTHTFSNPQPRGFVIQITQALEYMSLFRMNQWLNALWRQKGYP